MHTGDSMAAEEIDEFLLPDGLHLARLNGFRRNFVGHVGENGAQAHDVARGCNFENHGLAVARSRRDFDLAKADDKHVTRRIAFREKLGAAGVAHHDPDAVVVLKGLWREIAEHPKMPVFAVEAILRWVMRVQSSHTFPAGLI